MNYTNEVKDTLHFCRCGLKDFHLVKFITSNNITRYQFQCFNCGGKTDCIKVETIPKHIKLDEVPFRDENISRRYWENKRLEYYTNLEEKQRKKREFISKYEITKEWRERRSRAINRNKILGGCCERCGKILNDNNTQVHHRRYEFLDDSNIYLTKEMRNLLVGKESPHDLEVLCEDCHKLLHKHLFYGENYDYS